MNQAHHRNSLKLIIILFRKSKKYQCTILSVSSTLFILHYHSPMRYILISSWSYIQLACSRKSFSSSLFSDDDTEDDRSTLLFSFFFFTLSFVVVFNGILNRYAKMSVPGEHSDWIFLPNKGIVRGTAKIIMVLASFRLQFEKSCSKNLERLYCRLVDRWRKQRWDIKTISQRTTNNTTWCFIAHGECDIRNVQGKTRSESSNQYGCGT